MSPDSIETRNEREPEIIPPKSFRCLDALQDKRLSRIENARKLRNQQEIGKKWERNFRSRQTDLSDLQDKALLEAMETLDSDILKQERKLGIALEKPPPAEQFIQIALRAKNKFSTIKGMRPNYVYGYDPTSGQCFARPAARVENPQYYRLNIENPHRCLPDSFNDSDEIDSSIVWLPINPPPKGTKDDIVLKILGQEAMKMQALREYVSGPHAHPHRVEDFLNEVPIRDFYPIVYKKWIEPQLPSTKIQNSKLVKMGILIARSLHIRANHKPSQITRDIIVDEIKYLKKARERFANIQFFDANIVMVADNEGLENMGMGRKVDIERWGEFRFCNKALWTALEESSEHFRRSNPERKTPKIFRPEKGAKGNDILKNEIFAAIINTPPPLLLYLEMHGDKKGVVIAGIHLKFEELALCFIERGNRWGSLMCKEILEKGNVHFCDRIVAANCFSTDWVHGLYQSFSHQSGESPKSIPPICFTDAERGFYGWTSPGSRYGSKTADNILKIGRAKTVTLGEIIHADDAIVDDFRTNPTLIVPLLPRITPYRIAKRKSDMKEREGKKPV